MTMQHRSALALALGTTLACATAQPPPPAAGARSEPSSGVTLPGCPIATDERVPVRPNAPLDQVVTITACTTTVERAAVEDRWYVRRHHQYDEHATPALEVAAMILTCVADGSCDPAVDPESFGIMHAYAATLPVKEVEQTILTQVPGMIGASFLGRLREVLPTFAAKARTLDAHGRDIFVDLPLQIRTERLADRAALAAFEVRAADQLAEVDAALEGIPSPDRTKSLLQQTRLLRSEALAKCTVKRSLRDCLDGPVVRPLTERLVQLALHLGDAPQAAAELEQLRPGTDKSTFPTHLAAELARRVGTHTALVIRYEEAKKAKTLTPVMLEAVYGKPAPTRVPDPVWGDGREDEDLDAQIAEIAETEKVHGIVRGSRGRGGALEIALEPCNGSEECRVHAMRPVLLAIAEARLLRIGEKLEAIVDRETRRGVVLYAYRTRPNEKLVQIRGTRLSR